MCMLRDENSGKVLHLCDACGDGLTSDGVCGNCGTPEGLIEGGQGRDCCDVMQSTNALVGLMYVMAFVTFSLFAYVLIERWL